MSDQTGVSGPLQEMRATFASSDQMQDAVTKLSLSGFDRADLSLPSPGVVDGSETSEESAKVVSTESDARQARTLGASMAASTAAIAAAGITIATGGAAVPVIAAAVAAGGAAGGSVFAIHGTADQMEQSERDTSAADGVLVLAVRVTTEAKRAEAEGILRAAGATGIERVA